MSQQNKKISKDMYLFREGDHPDAMYIIKSGGFAITKTKGNSEVILAEIKTGAMVGEMAIFDRKPRSANVKATKDSEVVSLPYEALEKQLDAVPVWIKAIMRTLNENLREANKKIKILESSDADADRFPPHMINKLLSILSFVGNRYGQKENGHVIIPSNRLRNYTIQVFQEPTNKMDSIQQALQELGMMDVEELGEGKKKITNKVPEFLFEFVDWYNDWLFKADKDKISLAPEEVKILDGVLFYAKKSADAPKGGKKVNLGEIQNDSMRDLGYVLKVDDVNPLIEKKMISEKIMEDGGVFVTVHIDEIEKPAAYWKLIADFKRLLR